jgi:integrase
MSKRATIAEKPGYFGNLFQRFEDFKSAQEGISEKTLVLYELAWKFWSPAFADDKTDLWTQFNAFEGVFTSKKSTSSTFSKAQEKAILDRLQALIAEKKRSTKPPSPTTLNMYGRVMNTFLKWLKDYEGVLESDLKLKEQITKSGDTREVFTQEEIAAIRLYKPRSLNQTRAWTIVMLMLDCGARVDEVLSLTKEDVDFRDQLIFIRSGKGNKSRRVPLSDAMRPILYRYIDKEMPKTARYIFGAKSGTKASQRNMLRDLGVVLRKAKVRELSFHCFRHTFASGYLKRGGFINKLQHILGHASIQTTQIYLHMADSYYSENATDFSSLTPLR